MVEIVHGWDPQKVSGDEKQLWLAAASQFRLPYWDWARKQKYTDKPKFGVPEICTKDSWPILEPGRDRKVVPFPNPLTGYNNPKMVDGKNVPFGDASMGKYAIPDDIEKDGKKQITRVLPVCVNFWTRMFWADPSSGANALELAAMESQMKSLRNGNKGLIIGSLPIRALTILNGTTAVVRALL